MSISVGGCVGAVSTDNVSEAVSGNDQVKKKAAISMLKKAMEADADVVKTLIASATGVGQKLDVNG